MRWLEETNKDFEIENMIIVGGESSNVTYPGPTVNEALKAISNTYNNNGGDIFCGGIAIPSRKEESKSYKKSKHGSEFFTTQVLYDSENAIKMINNYQKRCNDLKTFPRRILLSFAPVSSQRILISKMAGC